MRRKAADNERTCYPFTVEKKDMKKHDMISLKITENIEDE